MRAELPAAAPAIAQAARRPSAFAPPPRDSAGPGEGEAPRLIVVSLSDSFCAAWSQLAHEAGLRLERAPWPAADLDVRGQAVGLVAAGGAEDALPDALRAVATPRMEVAAVGALTSHRIGASAVRAGAGDYFALPGDLDRLRSWLSEQAQRLRERVQRLAFVDAEASKYRFDGILGDSPALMRALSIAARVIPHPNVTVLVTGETGTGKELLARAIHYNGPRRAAPFVDVNCAALPEHLLESELFGHEKGAFTDASATKPGLLELADRGTLFLDEIGHLALPLQAKLLRALQERQIRRVGGTRSIAVDVRIIAATHVDLAGAVRAGAFREDLYYRLNVLPVELPPLRARRGDVVTLARHFLDAFVAEYGVPLAGFSAEAIRTLRERDWPGNVRELRNAIERAVLVATGPVVEASALEAPAAPGPSTGGGLPFPATIDEVVHAAAVLMLERCDGNKSETARRLGISRPRLLRILGEEAEVGDAPGGAGDDEAQMSAVYYGRSEGVGSDA